MRYIDNWCTCKSVVHLFGSNLESARKRVEKTVSMAPWDSSRPIDQDLVVLWRLFVRIALPGSLMSLMKDFLGKIVEQTATCLRHGRDAVADSLERHRRFVGGAGLIDGCSVSLIEKWTTCEFHAQCFCFGGEGPSGVLVQIARSQTGNTNRIVRTVAGQELAVCVRLVRNGDDAEMIVSGGKWIDKMLSGAIAWTVFMPLLAIPAIGAYRQQKLIGQVEGDVEQWFSNHQLPPVIDVGL